MQIYIENFDQLPLYFEGNSRILRHLPDSNFLVSKLKPTVFSLEENGPVFVSGIDLVRTQLNALFSHILHENGIKTSTVHTEGSLIFMEKHAVPPIEVVVKGALVGSPKHIYKGIDQALTRFQVPLEKHHKPYVRFDWRNPLPMEDQCMPNELADYFIDTQQASQTALKAFRVLHDHCAMRDLKLLDICFFMNTAGNVICAEVSTDNTRIAYTGQQSDIRDIVSAKNKNQSLAKAQMILTLLEAK